MAIWNPKTKKWEDDNEIWNPQTKKWNSSSDTKKETKKTKETKYSDFRSSRAELEKNRLVKQYSSRNPLDYMQKADAESELLGMGYSEKEIKKLRKDYRASKDDGLDIVRSGAFGRDDIGAVEKGVLGVGGTGLHVARNLVEGAILNPLEGGADAIRYGTAYILDGLGAKKTAQTFRDVAKENDMQKLLSFSDDYFERNSTLGEDTEGFVQALGQVFGLKGLGSILSKVGLSAKGVSTAITGTNFLTSAGMGTSEAYQSGATDKEALKYGLMQGGIDAGTELLSGGLGKGTKALGLSHGVLDADDLIAKSLTKNMKNQTAKNTVEGLIKGFGEGGEEWLAGYLSAHAQKGTFRSEDSFEDIKKDQQLGKQFLTGMLVSDIAQAGSIRKASKQGVDYVTGYTQNEQSVVDKIANDEIQKAEKDGKKLSTKEKNKIKEDVETMLQRGEIDIDTIESTLGGETYKAHESLVKESEEFETLRNKKQGEMTDVEQDRLKELKAKNTEKSYSDLIAESKSKLSEEVNLATQNDMFLRESYAERGRRGEKFTVSEEQMKKYSAKEKEIVQKAIDYGEMNNTRKAHEFVDLVAKLSADKGVSFDFTNNEKLKNSGFALEGKTINGYKSGNNIVVNLQSKNALNTVVGHEITHVLEGSKELYKALQDNVIEYAKQKGVYDSMYKEIVHLYRNQFQDKDLQKRKALYDSEITADLVGQYIFSDVDFVRNLSIKNQNIFQRMYDEIKYFLKTVTSGSDAEKQLLKAKKIFEDVYRSANKNASDDVRFSIREEAPPKNTKKAYKLMRYVDGKYYPLFIGNNEAIEQGVWYNADSPNLDMLKTLPEGTHMVDMESGDAITFEQYLEDNVGRKKDGSLPRTKPNAEDIRWANENGYRFMLIEDKSGTSSAKRFKSTYGDSRAYYNWGINGSAKSKTGEGSASLYALRPGWHFGDLPSMRQIGYTSDSGAKDMRLDNQVWVEVEMSADVDYNEEARSNYNGDIPTHIPKDGYYEFATNPTQKKTKSGESANDKSKGNWYVSGAFKIVRPLGDVEARQIVDDYNKENGTNVPYDYERAKGRVFNADTMQLEDGVQYSVSDNKGRTLTKEQQEKFKDSKVRDENGNLLTMYHGTNATNVFTEFNIENGAWLSTDYDYAKEYSGWWNRDFFSKGEGLGKDVYTDNNLRIYEMYANIKNPFNLGEINGTLSDGKVNELANAFGHHVADNTGDMKQGGAVAREVRQLAKDYIGEKTYFFTRTKEFIDFAKKQGFDGFEATEDGTKTYCVFDTKDQVKLATNKTPTKNDDIRFSLSDNQGNAINPLVQKRFANSKAVDENGDLKVLYHGTYNGDFSIFDKTKGSVEGDFGSGFYFTDNESDVEANYEGGGPDFENKVSRRAEQIESEEDIDYHEAEERARKELYKGSGKFEVYLNIENPAIVGETRLLDMESYMENYDESDFEDYDEYMAEVEQLISDDIDSVVWDVEQNIDIYGDTSGIATILWESVNEGGLDIADLKAKINELYLEDSEGNLVGNEVTRQIIESLGYDGIIDNTVSSKFSRMGLSEDTTHYIVFKPNQIKAITNQNPTDNPDINLSLSDQNKPLAPKPNGIYAEDIALEKPIAPIEQSVESNNMMQEEVAPTETPQVVAPLNNQVDNKEKDEFDLFMDLFNDEDSAKENTEEVNDPFEERNIKEVGKRNVNAYMYDNPEVKPFFQEEANIMLGELQRSTKGERHYNDQLYYDTNGEQGFYGTKRDTSDAIADLLDNYNYSYADIEKGLKAIIEDNGAENIAVAKKIEFFINERLINGYTDFQSGLEIPKNQDYIDLLEGMQENDSADLDSLEENIPPLAPTDHLGEVNGMVEEEKITAPEETEAEGIKGEDLTRKNAEKIKVIQGKIESYRMTRSATTKEFDERIAKKKEEYEALQRKDTKKAVDLRNQITNLESRKDAMLKDLDRKIDRSTKQIENIEQESRFNKRQTKQKEFRELFGMLMGDTSTWVDKKMGIQYQTNTLRRNLRDIVRDKNGNQDIAKADAIYDELQGSVNRNEAKKNREGNALKNKFREMKINKHESTYIQMLGEFQNNPDSELSIDEVSDFYNKHKQDIDVEKVNKAIEEARKLYDSLYERVNESLEEHGFKGMGYRKGYFPHFNDPKQNWLGKLLNWKVQNDEIPTDIAGLTELFEPQRTWQSFDKHRRGDTTDYNFLKGLDNYVDGALDWIYHIEDIQKHRAFETEIRYRHSSEQVQKEIDKIRENPFLSTEEAETLIQSKLREAKNPLNNFVTDLHTRTNILAGKKSSKDRNMESDFNRHAYSVMTNISNRVTANQVVGSISSAITNFIPITQSWGQVNPTSSVVGMKQTLQSYIKDDGIVDKSDFLTNRLRQNENLYKTAWDRTGEVVGGLMEVVDNFTSQTVWRSKYYENIKNGMTEEQAIKDADQFTENVIAGRSKGNQPTIFHAKNPVSKMLTSFQLEVANQYGYMFKDMPQDIGKKAIGKLTKGYLTMFVGAYFYNAMTSALTGRDSAFDPLGILEDLMKDLFGDEEEEKKETSVAIGNFAKNVAEEVPFVGGLLGGGRIPISSALPYNASISDAYADVVDKDWKSVAKELSKPLYYGIMPMGGGQIKKTVEGLKMFDEDLPTSGSYTSSGNLRYPVEKNLKNIIQSALFGQYANENARYYFDNNLAPLKEKQIQEYVDLDIPIKDYWKYREGLKEQKKVAEKFDYVAGLEHPISKKNIMINNIVDREKEVDLTGYENYGSYEEFNFATNNAKKYDFLKKYNISYQEYTSRQKVYDWAYKNPSRVTIAKATTGDLLSYKFYQDTLNAFESDKNAKGDSIPNSLKNKKFAYINNLDVDYNTKMLLWKQQYPNDDRYNAEIIDYLDNRQDISYEEMVEILEELEFEVSEDGTVRW